MPAVADPSTSLRRSLRRLNRLRRTADGPSERAGIDAAADVLLDRPSTRLVVYGSLAPGEVNAHVLEPCTGRWKTGIVRGVVHDRGWESGRGFPALVWDPEADGVEVRVFVSDDLPDRWDRLDAFEGPGYDRILVPVEGLAADVKVCNAYVAAGTGGPDA